ncbi:N-acetylmuramoyl-L-alanine amidase [Pseudobdellovibrio sp. HCB154]|uniref:N-acetylmuramoyl-L-alanine amidase family protein n=1 Tax=Pseudobdellovibrio sp. HCB154 TaxID=3386277 RepID=UPI003916E82B
MRQTLLSLILIFSFLTALAQLPAKPFVLVIDPGHGGVDAGAVRGIFKESDITLKVAQKMQSLIQGEFSQNIEVILTRETDKSLSLENRVRLAEQKKADLFISLHANSSQASYVTGMEFYFKKGIYAPKLPAIEASTAVKKIIGDLTSFGQIRQSLKFNQLLQNQIKAWRVDEKTVIKRAPFFVIEKTSMPSALIEIGYISNLSEAKLLLTDERQQEIAETIAKTIYDFKNLQVLAQ